MRIFILIISLLSVFISSCSIPNYVTQERTIEPPTNISNVYITNSLLVNRHDITNKIFNNVISIDCSLYIMPTSDYSTYFISNISLFETVNYIYLGNKIILKYIPTNSISGNCIIINYHVNMLENQY